MPATYAELLCRTAFSFREGASLPEEIIDRAAELGIAAVAITDREGVYGIPRAHKHSLDLAAGHLDPPPGSRGPSRPPRPPKVISGATVTVVDGPGMALLARTKEGWSHLCRLLTRAHCGGVIEDTLVYGPDHPEVDTARSPHAVFRDVEKGRGRVALEDILSRAAGLEAVLVGDWAPGAIRQVTEAFGEHASLAVSRHLDAWDDPGLAARRDLARRAGIPLVATSDVVMHTRRRKRLQDVLTCIRLRCTVDEAGTALDPHAERILQPPEVMLRRYASVPEALTRTLEIAERCTFSLADLAYVYPREVVPEGQTPIGWLRELTERGLAWRYPGGVPARVRRQVAHELDLIERLDFPAYFLTVYDSVRYARERGILCQGRGSAANSAVCYALGVTSVDPTSTQLLFERFISEERGEPPDIDVDFEHERREEVIQYVYGKYGRHRAGMVNEVISYRAKSAMRDVGKALGLSLDQVDRLAGNMAYWDTFPPPPERLVKAGIDPEDARVQLALELALEIKGLPRHVGVHVGGFTISDGPLCELVPIEPATKEDRTVIQWDKDDIDIVKFVKVDLLSLGMLTAIRRCFDFVEQHRGLPLSLGTVPEGDPEVYDMICKADTVGVFQIESRAQMSMLPRLQPRSWYDLVIEVSIVRPGPIQGGMVHPYLARRRGEEPTIYAHPKLRPILERTLGVPIFQEQVMAMAVAVGGFTPGQADQLRRAMGAWRKRGNLGAMTEQLMAGMAGHGISAQYAEQIAKQIQGFGEYGFPESHAASFARLVYISCWLKHHFPAAFTAALINSQPMGFYSPRALVADAQRHEVEIRPVDVRHSDWDCTLEPVHPGGSAGGEAARPAHLEAIRLGLRLVKSLGEEVGRRIEAARAEAPFRGLGDLQRRAALSREALVALARADALRGLGPPGADFDRRQAVWAVQGLYDLPLFRGLERDEGPAPIPAPTVEDHLVEDFRMVGLSVDLDPVAMVREELSAQGYKTALELRALEDGTTVRVAGLVSNRQRPGTASGIVFMTLEDETGMLNLVVKPKVLERQRDLILGSNLLRATCRLQRDGDSLSLLVFRFAPLDRAPRVESRSRDFH